MRKTPFYLAIIILLLAGCSQTKEVADKAADAIPEDYQPVTWAGKVMVIAGRVYRLVRDARAERDSRQLGLTDAELERIDLASIIDDLETIRREVGISSVRDTQAEILEIMDRLADMIVSDPSYQGRSETP